MKAILKEALKEDIGRKDITTQALISPKEIRAALVAKEPCVVCGLSLAGMVFKLMDKRITFKPEVCDGQKVKRDKVLAFLRGPAQDILSAERVALNFLSLLCAVATKTRQFVEVTKPYGVRIMDTRKTIPGLRILQKYAVRIGGGYNHRFKLDELIMAKDNHLKIIGGPRGLKKKWKNLRRKGKPIEIEVNHLDEFQAVLDLKPDIIMLDNMTASDIKKAVLFRNKHYARRHPLLEASGGISLRNIKKIASTGVDMISIGSLTHSIDSVDISLEIL
ncbi:MAG: carboxylating nicotinate-nucleotide diphosphorylase [Candidatus Omnitrophota bacterium]